MGFRIRNYILGALDLALQTGDMEFAKIPVRNAGDVALDYENKADLQGALKDIKALQLNQRYQNQ